MIKLVTHLFLIISLFIISCSKKSPKPELPVSFNRPFIQISQKIEGCKVENNSNFAKELEASVIDSVFTIYRLSGQTDYFPLDLYFSAIAQDGQIKTLKWKIGSDPVERVTNDFTLSFNKPVDFPVTVFIDWIPNATASLRKDTLYKTVQISSKTSVPGYFRGVNAGNPTDTFTIYAGELVSNVIGGNQDKFFGVQNLFKDFPVNLPINIYSAGFGICQAPFPYAERYTINGKTYSQPFGVATLNSLKDSIYINYSYVEYKDGVSYDNMKTIQQTFAGRRL